MCIGETTGDTLRPNDMAVIATSADRELSGHQLAFECNDDGMTWAVLAPCDPTMLRFTVCRIDPCFMVLIEDADGRRQIRSMAEIEEIMDFIGTIASGGHRATEPQQSSRTVH